MSTTTKYPYAQIRPVADRLVAAISPYCHRVEIAGSLRREAPHVGDIEIVAIPKQWLDLFSQPLAGDTLLDSFLYSENTPFLKNGARYKQFIYGSHTVDLFLTSPERWASIFTIRTGSADFSHWLVTPQPAGGAAPRGLSFHDGRLHVIPIPGLLEETHYYGSRILLTPEESDIFAALGLAYIPPPERAGPPSNPIRVDPIWRFEE